MLIASLVIMSLGALALSTFGSVGSRHWEIQVVAGCILVWSLGSPVSSTATVASFSAVLGKKPQGLAMGVIGAAGSMGRIILPLVSASIVWSTLYRSLFVAFLLLAVFVIVYKRKFASSN